MIKPGDRKVRAFKGSFIVLAIGFLCLSYFELPSSAYAPLANVVSGISNSVTVGFSSSNNADQAAASSNRPSILFTCPDGRIGLHLVHTRFLIGQASATPLFIASRLALLRTFLVPSLNAQTSQNFVFYASYDPKLGDAASQAFTDTLNGLSAAHIVALKQDVPANGNWGSLNFSSVAAKLHSIDPRVQDVDLFITSRIDADDAAHYDAISAVQEHACSGGGNADAGSGKDAVRVVYLQNGELWFPSGKDEYGTAGVWKTGKDVDDLYRVLAIMQSMVLAGKNFISSCSGKLNVYGMRHYQPEDLETVIIDRCKFRFSARKNVLYWNPPDGDLGNLYVRTASSWTRDKDDLQYQKRPTNVEDLERSFGVSPAVLAATNLLFAGFQKEAPELVSAKGAVEIE